MTGDYWKGNVPPHVAKQRMSIEDAIDMFAAIKRLEARFFNQPAQEVEAAIAEYAQKKRAEQEEWERANG